jgi:nucleoside phosphorylase
LAPSAEADTDTRRVDFAIVTPLEEERDAVLSKVPNHRKLPPEGDVRVYFEAEVPAVLSDGSVTTYNVVVAMPLNMGRVEATNVTKDVIHRWQPRYILLVGIAGGCARNGVKLGDVIVSDQIVDVEIQKLTEDKAQPRWQVHRAAPGLLSAVQNCIGDEWQDLISVERPAEGVPNCVIGPICSGDKVIADGSLDHYMDSWPKLVGVEMEAGGVASAAFQTDQPAGFLMVRGVSDLADESKDSSKVKKWRAYACDVAASYAIALLRSGPIPPPSAGKDGGGV